MPKGSYRHLDADGRTRAVERFSCAPGPDGWRYVSEVRDPDGAMLAALDLVVDARWRQLAVSVHTGEVSLQGGVAGDEVVWGRVTPSGAEDGAEAAGAFGGESAGFLVTVARRLHLHEGDRGSARLVRLTGPRLEPALTEEEWELTGVRTYVTDTVPLPVERYEVADVATGHLRVVHLAGDVVLDAPGLAMDALESPPTLPGGSG